MANYSIKRLFGLTEAKRGKKPPLGSGERFKRLERKLSQESRGPTDQFVKQAGMMNGGYDDPIREADEDEDEDDAPKAKEKSDAPAKRGPGRPPGSKSKPKAPSGPRGASVPADVAEKIRAAIEALESIVPDEDPEGDIGMEDGFDSGPLPDDGMGMDDLGDDVEESIHDPAALAASIGRKKYGNSRFQQMAAAGRRRR